MSLSLPVIKKVPSSILVVEDDHNMKDLLVEFLNDEGHRAYGAQSHSDALSLVSSVRFDLLITDVRMAGLDGIDGLARLKEVLPTLKCIVITGYADLEALTRGITNEIDDYIQKPFRLDELQSTVQRVLSEQHLAEYYLELFQQVPAKLFTAATRFFKKDLMEALDDARSRSFQGFYVAVRSEMIPVNSANGIFSKLISLDFDYRDYLAEPDPTEARRLESEYIELFNFLTKLSRNRTPMIGGERLDAIEFRRLYEAIRCGEITPEQLQLAPVLRHVDHRDLTDSPDLLELHKKLWATAS